MSASRPERGQRGTVAPSPLDRPSSPRSRLRWAVLAVLAHAVLLAGAALVPAGQRQQQARSAALVSQMFEVKLEKPPEPEPEVEPEPEPEVEPEPPRPAPVRRKAKPEPAPPQTPEPEPVEPEPAPEPAAAEAAEAAEVMTAEPGAAEAADTVVSGSGDTPVGGASSAQGSAQQPVRDDRARADGVIGGSGEAPAPSVDRSRPPGLAGGARWNCPFPREADFAGIDQAAVVLGVKVGTDGQVQSVGIHDDPGHGFGREARRCALRKRWRPGLDKRGEPLATTVYVRVRFKR